MATPDHTPQGRGYDTSLLCAFLALTSARKRAQ
jgi:hypothetical protein